MTIPKTSSITVATLLLGVALFALVGCEQESEVSDSGPAPDAATQEQTVTEEPSSTATLASELEARKAAFEQRATDEIKALYADGIQAVVDAGVVEQAKKVGDDAPGFTLQNQEGEDVSLASLLEQGPVVLLWYRGGWCPYCNLTLAAYQQRLDEIQGLDATLVALTPELPDKSLSTAEKSDLEFQVLSDVGNDVARAYGVVFELTEGVQANYEKNFGLSAFNGDQSGELPLAATYVIDQEGQIRWAFLDADYRNRAEPRDVIAALEQLQHPSNGG